MGHLDSFCSKIWHLSIQPDTIGGWTWHNNHMTWHNKHMIVRRENHILSIVLSLPRSSSDCDHQSQSQGLLTTNRMFSLPQWNVLVRSSRRLICQRAMVALAMGSISSCMDEGVWLPQPSLASTTSGIYGFNRFSDCSALKATKPYPYLDGSTHVEKKNRLRVPYVHFSMVHCASKWYHVTVSNLLWPDTYMYTVTNTV